MKPAPPAKVLSDFYEARWKLRGAPKDSFDFQEANRWMRQSEDLVFKIIENHKDLYACIAEIQILFPKTEKIESLINRIYFQKGITLTDVPAPKSEAQLERWKTEAVNQLQRLVEAEYGAAIDDLGGYLRAELSN